MVDDDTFEESREQALDLLSNEDVDGLYVGVTRDDELDYAFAYRFDEAERVGMRALSLLARHVQVIADESGVAAEEVAADAGRLAAQLGEGRRTPEPSGGESADADDGDSSGG